MGGFYMSLLTSKMMDDFFKSIHENETEYVEPVYFVSKAVYKCLLKNRMITEGQTKVRTYERE
jgi:hypothetical protein